MQWHWGNIGSFLAGLSTVVIALTALRQGPAAVRAWIAGKQAQAALADEQRKQVVLERRVRLNGWSGHGIHTYEVTLVTDPDEAGQAVAELGKTTDYVVLRVSEQDRGANGERARDLRQFIEEGYISRPPSPGEREALEAGIKALSPPDTTPVVSRSRARSWRSWWPWSGA
jgi:hypothetical protein